MKVQRALLARMASAACNLRCAIVPSALSASAAADSVNNHRSERQSCQYCNVAGVQ